MSIRKYELEGRTYYEAYVNARSKVIPRIRVQKSRMLDQKGNRFENEAAAISEERKLIREAMEALAKLELRGLRLDEIVDRWESHHLKYPSSKLGKPTVLDNAQRIRNWAKDWLSKSASEINRGDARALFRKIEEQGKSVGFRKALKSSINVVYKWAIEERLVRDIHNSPVHDLDLGPREEDPFPEILTKEQIKKLLYEARDREHPWYSIWNATVLTGGRSGEMQGLRKEDCFLVSKEVALMQDQLPPKERNYGHIIVKRSWSKRLGAYKCTKANYWRTVPVSSALYWFLQDLFEQDFGADEHGQFLLPRFQEWRNGDQAAVLRSFCEQVGLPSICFHTLRACFATHLLALGIPNVKVMRIGGWKNLKTMERYMRLAGVEVAGATELLDLTPPDPGVMENVVNLYNVRMFRKQ